MSIHEEKIKYRRLNKRSLHFRNCDEKNFGVSTLCNLDLSAGLPKPQIWGTQVLEQLNYTPENPAPGEKNNLFFT